MAKRMVLVSMVAALSFGLCDAMNTNIFGVEYKSERSLEDLNRLLSDKRFNPDAAEVARLLAITKGKDHYPKGGGRNTVQELLSLGERPNVEPESICRASQFDYYKKMCDSLTGPNENARLLNYCKHCYKAHYHFCVRENESPFDFLMRQFPKIYSLVRESEDISEWIVSDGEEGESDEVNISQYMDRWDRWEKRDQIFQNCAELVSSVKGAMVLFFDGHDKRSSKFLAHLEKANTKNKDPQDYRVIYKRCTIINKLNPLNNPTTMDLS